MATSPIASDAVSCLPCVLQVREVYERITEKEVVPVS
jgi:hypothetical protein